MTLKERVDAYVKKYTGVSIDFDNMFGAQCVDVARHAWQTLHGLNRAQQPNTTPSGGARDLINNVRVPLRVIGKNETPEPGDMVIWGPMRNNGGWGHVALLVDIGGTPDCRNYTVFEQDGLNQGRGAQLRVVCPNGITGFIRYEG